MLHKRFDAERCANTSAPTLEIEQVATEVRVAKVRRTAAQAQHVSLPMHLFLLFAASRARCGACTYLAICLPDNTVASPGAEDMLATVLSPTADSSDDRTERVRCRVLLSAGGAEKQQTTERRHTAPINFSLCPLA